MSYRDDVEALHLRIAQLEQELATARREGEAHARDVATMSAELAALRGKARPRPAPRAAKPFVAVAAVALALALTAGAFVVSLRRPAVKSAASTSAPTVTARAVPAPNLTPAPPPTIDPARASRHTTATWKARVVRADGLALAPGAPCEVLADISTKDTNAAVDALSVQCGMQILYRSTDPLNGMSQSSDDARERLGPDDHESTFTLSYRDIGTRSGERTQVDLDSTKHLASVFRETLPRFRVDLSLAEESAPSSPLSGPAQRLRREGKVTRVRGAPAVRPGASCVLRAMPNGQGMSCTAVVTCGTTTVWPSTGPVACQYDDAARPLRVETTPEQGGTSTLGWGEGQITVDTRTFGMEIALDP